MSIRLMTQVWELELPHPQLLVCLALADVGDDDGSSIYPSLGTVAWKCGYSDRQVRRIVRDLESSGLLVKVAEATQDRGTEYRMVIAAGTPKSPRPRKEGADKLSGGSKRPGGHTGSGGADIAVSANSPSNPSSPADAGDGENAREPKPFEVEAQKLCRLLAELMRGNEPSVKIPQAATKAQRDWITDMRLLIAKDRGGNVAEVEEMIRWTQDDEFWRSNILSPGKLREQFPRLKMKRAARDQARTMRTDQGDDRYAGLSPAARARMERTLRRTGQTNPPQENTHDHHRLTAGSQRALGPGGGRGAAAAPEPPLPDAQCA